MINTFQLIRTAKLCLAHSTSTSPSQKPDEQAYNQVVTKHLQSAGKLRGDSSRLYYLEPIVFWNFRPATEAPFIAQLDMI